MIIRNCLAVWWHQPSKRLEINYMCRTVNIFIILIKPVYFFSVREEKKELDKQYDKSENDLKALQSVGQIVGEVLKQLTEEKFIVKATNGPRYVVGCRRQLDKGKLKVRHLMACVLVL